MSKKIKKNAVVLTSKDLMNGYIPGSDFNIHNLTPLQMIPAEEKDDDWKMQNMDWLERVGLRQLNRQSRELIKNYHLANALIDKTDYIIGPENDMSGAIEQLVQEGENSIPLKFFPIIPNVVSVLTGEFSKRTNRIVATAVDEYTHKEVEEAKHKEITDILGQRAEAQRLQELIKMGIDVNDERLAPQIKGELDVAKELAQVETKYKTYRTIPEQWANHILKEDEQRFSLGELECKAFRDMIVTDREFWHIKLMEDDYKIELWNPVNTFYHKSPDVDYISEGNYVGRIMIMSIPDVIDNYGDKMSAEQLEVLKTGLTSLTQSGGALVDDAYKDQKSFFTDYSKPHPQGITNVTMQKYMDKKIVDASTGEDNAAFKFGSWADLKNIPSDYFSTIESPGMLRVTEGYWKSQRRVFKLTVAKIDPESGKSYIESQDITVDENYKVTENPIYDKSLHQVENEQTLIYGEHLKEIWINEVRWGAKITSTSSVGWLRNSASFQPIYLGGDPIPFQFKGEYNLYGCKLPVEGRIFSERNSLSNSVVGRMKSNQISFNIVNNQILEMIADDPGTVMVIDQNMIPRNSMGGEWGKHNFAMMHQIMRDYGIAPVDPSIRNTESATNFAHFQGVDMSKTNMILRNIKLADWFKQQCFEVVGISPQRVGEVTASESATGTQQAVNNSYSQTEPLFNQHMNELMPRVRQLALDAAQFITATKPSSRIAYLTSDDEKEWFSIEGYRLLLRDFRIKCQSSANIREAMQKLEQIAYQSRGAGASLYEIARMVTLDSPNQIIQNLKEFEDKKQKEVEAQRQHEQEMQQQQQQFLEQEEAKKTQHDDFWKGKQLETQIMVAEIRAAQAKNNDLDGNGVPDTLEAMKFLEAQKTNTANIFQKGQEMDAKNKLNSDMLGIEEAKLQLAREEMASKERIEQLKSRTALLNKVSGQK